MREILKERDTKIQNLSLEEIFIRRSDVIWQSVLPIVRAELDKDRLDQKLYSLSNSRVIPPEDVSLYARERSVTRWNDYKTKVASEAEIILNAENVTATIKIDYQNLRATMMLDIFGVNLPLKFNIDLTNEKSTLSLQVDATSEETIQRRLQLFSEFIETDGEVEPVILQEAEESFAKALSAERISLQHFENNPYQIAASLETSVVVPHRLMDKNEVDVLISALEKYKGKRWKMRYPNPGYLEIVNEGGELKAKGLS